MLLKYLSSFWRSLETPFINGKVELKLTWTNCYVLFAAGADNDDANSNIIFTVKEKILHVSVVTLSAKEINNYQNFLAVFKGSMYGNKYKAKNDNKDTTNEYKHFL